MEDFPIVFFQLNRKPKVNLVLENSSGTVTSVNELLIIYNSYTVIKKLHLLKNQLKIRLKFANFFACLGLK